MLFIETISFVKLNVIEMLRRKMGRIRTADINICVCIVIVYPHLSENVQTFQYGEHLRYY